MGEKLRMKVAIFPRFCPVLSLTERFVWRFRGFDWRVSQLSPTSFRLFGVFLLLAMATMAD